MGSIIIDSQSFPETAPSNNINLWIDDYTQMIMYKTQANRNRGYIYNASIADQVISGVEAYIIDSDLRIPTTGNQASVPFVTNFRWMISLSKTAAGVGQPSIYVRIGTTRSTSDTSQIQLIGVSQTANADVATLIVEVNIRQIGSASRLQASACFIHRGTAASSTIGAGFANDGTGHVQGSSPATVNDSLFPGQYIGLSINPGASAVWTITQVQSIAKW